MPATPPAPAPAAGPPALPRVAVLAVHGIADQQRGDTGQAVALQLAAACGGSVLMHDLPLHAPPLDAAAPLGPSRPDTWQQRGLRSLQQSWRSDFLDDAIGGAPSTEGATGGAPAPRRNSAGAGAADAPTPSRAVADTGVRFTDYLLAQAQGARQAWGEPFNAAVGTVQGPHLRADVYEMYWADLSRLSGSVARIVAELFTLLFDLSRLGADELSLAGRLAGSRLLRTLGRVQRAADWLFSRVLALLALQLLMCAMLLLPALWPLAQGPGARRWAVGLVGVGCAAALVYRLHWRWRRALPAGAVLALAVAALVSSTVGPAALMLTWVGVLSAGLPGLPAVLRKALPGRAGGGAGAVRGHAGGGGLVGQPGRLGRLPAPAGLDRRRPGRAGRRCCWRRPCSGRCWWAWWLPACCCRNGRCGVAPAGTTCKPDAGHRAAGSVQLGGGFCAVPDAGLSDGQVGAQAHAGELQALVVLPQPAGGCRRATQLAAAAPLQPQHRRHRPPPSLSATRPGRPTCLWKTAPNAARAALRWWRRCCWCWWALWPWCLAPSVLRELRLGATAAARPRWGAG
jgi:hypothetical protein